MNKNPLISLALIALMAILLGWLHEERTLHEEVTMEEETREELVPYEFIFREMAPEIGWEWYMLAAVAYHESRFNPTITSPSGAKGIMQLMSRTGRRFGLNDSTFYVPYDNIQAGTRYIHFLQDKFYFIHNQEEKMKFVIASYNTGPGNVFEARRQAKENELNAYRWADVEQFMTPAHTRTYVNKVLETARRFHQLEIDLINAPAQNDTITLEQSNQ